MHGWAGAPEVNKIKLLASSDQRHLVWNVGAEYFLTIFPLLLGYAIWRTVGKVRKCCNCKEKNNARNGVAVNFKRNYRRIGLNFNYTFVFNSAYNFVPKVSFSYILAISVGIYSLIIPWLVTTDSLTDLTDWTFPSCLHFSFLNGRTSGEQRKNNLFRNGIITLITTQITNSICDITTIPRVHAMHKLGRKKENNQRIRRTWKGNYFWLDKQTNKGRQALHTEISNCSWLCSKKKKTKNILLPTCMQLLRFYLQNMATLNEQVCNLVTKWITFLLLAALIFMEEDNS